ncbi:MAG: sigma 54-interacting transcriptional regulator [bacterium]
MSYKSDSASLGGQVPPSNVEPTSESSLTNGQLVAHSTSVAFPTPHESGEAGPHASAITEAHLIGARYREIRSLGQGGTGATLLVADTADGDALRALKWITAPARDDAPAAVDSAALACRAALAGEFQLLATLDHPHLTRVFDFGHDARRGGWYLVEEWSNGTTFPAHDPARSPAFTDTTLADLAHQLLGTLAFLHERGIVHGDIQPGNVLLEDRDGTPYLRLIDFSGALARWLPAGAVTGTPGYVAPEVLSGAPRSPATDLYAAGVLLAGARPPHDGSNGNGARTALDDLCDGLRQRDPSLRLASAHAAARILSDDAAAPAQPSSVAQAPLFGRERALEQALAQLGFGAASAPTREARLVVVDGAVGIGKSRFLDEIETRARLEGTRVARVHADRDRARTELAPGELTVFDPLPHPLSPAGRAIRAALVESATDAAALGPRIAGAPASEDDAHAWSSCLAEQLSSRAALWIALGPLDEPACEALAAWVSPRHEGSAACGSIARRSGGNPLLLLELVNARAAGRDLPERGRGVNALTDRIRALPEPERRVLAALAILDDNATAAEIACVIDRAAQDVHVLLRRLETRGLVEASPSGDSRWESRHGLATETALTACDEDQRAAWHQRAARAREEGVLAARPLAIARDWLRGREPLRTVTTLARSWDAVAREHAIHGAASLLAEASGLLRREDAACPDWLFLAHALELGGEPESALECAERAGATATTPSERVAAAVARAAALKALGRVAEASAALDVVAADSDPRVAEMRMRLATLAGKPLEALATADLHAGAAAALDSPAIWVQRGYAHAAMGQHDLARELFERARAALAPDATSERPARALAASGLGVLAMQAGEHARAAQCFRDAIADSDGASSVRERATFRLNLAAALHGQGELLQALATYAEAAEELRAAGARRELAHALASRASLLAFLGDLRAARALAAEACAVLPSSADANAGIFPWLVAASAAVEDGQLEDAERAARSVLERSAPRSRERALALHVVAEAARRRGDAGAALAALGDVLTLAASLDARDLLARAFLSRGRIASRTRPEREADLRLALATFTEVGERIGRAESALTLVALLEENGDPAGQAHELVTLAHQAIREQARLVPDRYRPLFLRSRRFDAAVLDAPDGAGGGIERPARVAAKEGEAARSVRAANRTLLDARLMRVLEINRRLASERDRQRLLERILDSAIELAEAERGFLIVHDGTALEIPVARNLDRETLARPGHLISRTIAERVLASGEPFDSPDAMADTRLASVGSVHDLRVRSVLCVPCRGDKGTVGALYLDHRFWADAFGPEDRVLVEAIADQAAIGLENLRLADELARRNAALERAQRDLLTQNQALAREAEAERARVAAVEQQLEHAQRENALRHRYDRIVGRSPAMVDVLRLVDRVTDTESTVLVYGESGTGKELIARAIHYNGPRSKAPFVSLNCGALPETLLEATLFGHRKGAFTGAIETRTGLFEEANGGTLFLDEVGDMSPTMQVRLLRAIQEGEIRPVGADRPVKVNVRIVAATHRDLRAEVEKGNFRQDLLYRLEVIVLSLPALRDRREDIPLIATHLLSELAGRDGKPAPALSRGALELLLSHDWPGNVRELASVLETARVLANGDVIQPNDLAASPAFHAIRARATAPAASADDDASAGGDFREQVQAFERKILSDSLARASGNMSRAARALGMDRAQMFRLLKRYGIGQSPATRADEPRAWRDDEPRTQPIGGPNPRENR